MSGETTYSVVALLPAARTESLIESVEPSPMAATNLLLDLIDYSDFNPRKTLDNDKLTELAESIRQIGVQSAVLVRPKPDGRYEIVYGERRVRASHISGKTTVPALIRDMTDEEALDAAMVENIQREDLLPFEEARIYRYMIDEKGKSVSQLCEQYAKSESHVRGRLVLLKLVPEVVEMLNNEEISIEMAKEFANYDENIQKEVYSQHFTAGAYSWKGITAKEFAKRLYEKYMTKLDAYSFDKTGCEKCKDNTKNQVLFMDAGECAGCNNRLCLQAKNENYLTSECIRLSGLDARLNLGYFPDSVNSEAVEKLKEAGYDVEEITAEWTDFDEGPDMPEMPQESIYADADSYRKSMEAYEADMERYKAECAELEFGINEGTIRKYAIIGERQIAIRYIKVKTETVTVTVISDGVIRTVPVEVPAEDPAVKLVEKDKRNEELRKEHTVENLREIIAKEGDAVPKRKYTASEEQLFYYIIIESLSYALKDSIKEGCSAFSTAEMFEYAGKLTEAEKKLVRRARIIDYFINKTTYSIVTPDEINMLKEFAMLHYKEQCTAALDKINATYDKRHENLQQRIDAILGAQARLNPVQDTEAVEVTDENSTAALPEAESAPLMLNEHSEETLPESPDWEPEPDETIPEPVEPIEPDEPFTHEPEPLILEPDEQDHFEVRKPNRQRRRGRKVA